jgi:hypothetical protein
MPDGPTPVEIPVAPPERSTPSNETRQNEQKGMLAKKFASKIREAFSRSGNSRDALQNISNGDQGETPAATKSNHAANKEYRQRMKQVAHENYNWTGFAKETYKHETFVHQEREAYAKAYGDDALAARDAATPQPEKPEKKQEQSAEGHHTTQPPEGDYAVQHSKHLLDMLSDEQLEDRVAIGDSGAELAKKTLEERQQGQQTKETTQSTPNSEPTPIHGKDKPDEEDNDIPTDKRGLFLFEKEHFDPLLQLPQDKIKDAFTPQIIDLYRRYLQNKVKVLIDNQPPNVTYPDTVAGVLGNNPSFIQRLIYAQTDQIINDVVLLKEPFSKLAAIMNIELPNDYAKHFRYVGQNPEEGREAA